MPPLSKVIPMKAVVERLQLHGSELLYVWVREKGRPSVWAHGIEATLENLGSRPGLTQGPMDLVALGTIDAKGKARVAVSAAAPRRAADLHRDGQASTDSTPRR